MVTPLPMPSPKRILVSRGEFVDALAALQRGSVIVVLDDAWDACVLDGVRLRWSFPPCSPTAWSPSSTTPPVSPIFAITASLPQVAGLPTTRWRPGVRNLCSNAWRSVCWGKSRPVRTASVMPAHRVGIGARCLID
jgi:hypothetical protein